MTQNMFSDMFTISDCHREIDYLKCDSREMKANIKDLNRRIKLNSADIKTYRTKIKKRSRPYERAKAKR